MAIKDESHYFALEQSLNSGILELLFLEVIFTMISKTTEKDVWGKKRRGEGLMDKFLSLFSYICFLKVSFLNHQLIPC